MPDFLGEFAASIRNKQEIMKQKVWKGTPNPLENNFAERLASFWTEINRAEFAVNPSEVNVLAVDSSIYSNLLSTGGVFYVVRSLGVCRNVEQKRLESDVFFSKGGSVTERDFLSVKMEMSEFQVAIDALKNGVACKAILIDGSLYGRLVHVPLESKVEEERLILVEYFRVYRELFEQCKKNAVLLVGVAKESRSTTFRDYLLSLFYNEELQKLKITDDDAKKLKLLFKEVIDRDPEVFKRFEKITGKYNAVNFENLGHILEELTRSRPDYQLIMNFADSVGYSKPLMLGASPNLGKRLEQYRTDPIAYVKRNFLTTQRERGLGFIGDAAGVIGEIPNFPAIASFYVLFDLRDSPIRVDVPCWDQTLVNVGWHNPTDIDVSSVLRILATGYCGLDCHNLWLKNVDERVRLAKKTVDNIYVPYMEKLFGEKLIRGRSYRRVKYP